MGNIDSYAELDDSTVDWSMGAKTARIEVDMSGRDLTPGEQLGIHVVPTVDFEATQVPHQVQVRSDTTDPGDPTTNVLNGPLIADEAELAVGSGGYVIPLGEGSLAGYGGDILGTSQFLQVRCSLGATGAGRARVFIGPINQRQTNRSQGPGV